MNALRSFRVAAFALVAALAADSALAQDISLTYGRRIGRGSLAVTIGLPARTCAPARVWVPGRYDVRCERVWIEGCERQVWVEPCYETRWDSCGRPYRVQVRPGHWRPVRDPGRWEQREVRVWIPGHWREAARY